MRRFSATAIALPILLSLGFGAAASEAAPHASLMKLLNRQAETQAPYTPLVRVDSATCICDGIPFNASCPGSQKVTCKCQPPGYSCSN